MRLLSITILCFYFPFLMAQSLEQVNINNGSMSYYSQGEGETILFIHGGQEDYRVFLPQVTLLSENFNVVTYSRRYNFPNDNKIIGDYNVKTEAEDLKILVQKLDKPVHLVGHSYGGLIAMEFALNNPESIKSLILSEPALINWLNLIPECETSFQDVQEKLINDTRRAFKTQDTTLVMKELFEFFAGADIQDQVPLEVLGMLKANLREMEALVNSNKGFEAPSNQSLQELKMPIMIFTSERTMPMLKCTNGKLLESLPEATHHHLEEAGHEMWMTNPEELSGYISAFLTK